jgi:hypothetical protein
VCRSHAAHYDSASHRLGNFAENNHDLNESSKLAYFQVHELDV